MSKRASKRYTRSDWIIGLIAGSAILVWGLWPSDEGRAFNPDRVIPTEQGAFDYAADNPVLYERLETAARYLAATEPRCLSVQDGSWSESRSTVNHPVVYITCIVPEDRRNRSGLENFWISDSQMLTILRREGSSLPPVTADNHMTF